MGPGSRNWRGARAGDPPATPEEAYRAAFERGVRAMAGREHSASELVRKLTGKGVRDDQARQVVADLGERNLQSDERFTETFVRSRVERGYGPLWIRQALRQRGVADDILATYLAAPASVWIARARQARQRRFGDPLPRDRDDQARQARFLAQRGFPTDVVMQAVDSQR